MLYHWILAFSALDSPALTCSAYLKCLTEVMESIIDRGRNPLMAQRAQIDLRPGDHDACRSAQRAYYAAHPPHRVLVVVLAGMF